MQEQTGSGKITAISLLLIIGLSIIGVIAALSGSEVKQSLIPDAVGASQPAPAIDK